MSKKFRRLMNGRFKAIQSHFSDRRRLWCHASRHWQRVPALDFPFFKISLIS